MIKELIKIANRLDTMGLKREADSVDEMIKKISAKAREKREQYQECDCFRCGARVIEPLDGGCLCDGCKPGYLGEIILECEEFLEGASERLEGYTRRLERAIEGGRKEDEEIIQNLIKNHSNKVMLTERKLEKAKDQLAELTGE